MRVCVQTKKKVDIINTLGMNHLGRCDSLGYGKELYFWILTGWVVTRGP